MRHTLFILVFCCSKLFSQVSPPDLRCLEILPNGNVLLTWLTPANTTGFFSYEVFYSNAPTGPFTAVSPVVTNVNATTYLHATTLGTVQSLYYYVVTNFGPAGASTSAPSETLRTIFISLTNPLGSVDLKFLYNDLHQPKLPSSSPTFTVNKEYPIGTPNVLGITADTKYADTVSVCKAVIAYYVTLKDISGCTSISSKITGTFTDTYRPGGLNGPVIDSISVLPDGTTVIAWQVPRDMDIIKYQIFSRATPTSITLSQAIVPGRPTTFYHSPLTTALNQPISLFVAAIDSCSNDPGIYNKSPVTMFLATKYNYCNYETQLNWTRYYGLRGGVLEYRIFYSSDGGSTFQQIANTTDTTFLHTGTTPGKDTYYFIRVINNPKTITASSNRAHFFTTQVRASNFVYIKTATVSGKSSAQLRLYLDTSRVSNGIDIYRSDDGVNFSNIGFLPFSREPNYHFDDNDVRTGNQSYFYKAIIKDSCGNNRVVSNIAKTILLKVQEDEDKIFTKHLSWSDYMGFSGGVNRYNVYRVINDVTEDTPVAVTNPTLTVYTDEIEDEATKGAKIEYMVQAIEGPGNIYGFSETGNSNAVAVYMDGRIYVPTAFAPNGVNKKWLPVTHYIDKKEYSVMVYNRWGHKVFETNSDEVAWDGTDCTPDVYVYIIRYKNSFGEYKEIKGTVLMLE